MIRSPIKYYGGKSALVSWLLSFLPKDPFRVYIEPFGGSGVFLLNKPLTPVEIYNDLNGNLYALYRVISNPSYFSEFKKLCDMALYHEKVSDEYRESLRTEELSLIERAFRFWYVNRTRFNGIGGFSINTTVNRGMSKSTADFLASVENMDLLHNRLRKVIISCRDGIELVRRYDYSDVFFYLDPPYHPDARTDAKYPVDMTSAQHAELIDAVLSLKKAKVLLSGYYCSEYSRLKDGWFVTSKVNPNSPKEKIEFLWRNYP